MLPLLHADFYKSSGLFLDCLISKINMQKCLQIFSRFHAFGLSSAFEKDLSHVLSTRPSIHSSIQIFLPSFIIHSFLYPYVHCHSFTLILNRYCIWLLGLMTKKKNQLMYAFHTKHWAMQITYSILLASPTNAVKQGQFLAPGNKKETEAGRGCLACPKSPRQ